MKMEPLNSGELRIWMTNGELERWGLNTENMQAGEPSTDRALRRLLAVARQRMTFSSDGIVTVEALPLEGGCLFLFSGCRRKVVTTAPQIYRIDTADTLLQFAQTLAQTNRYAPYPCTSLYRQNDQYFLIVYAGLGPTRRVCRIAEEYGTRIGEGETTAAMIEEHASLITVGDALNRLCEAYGSLQQVPQHRPR